VNATTVAMHGICFREKSVKDPEAKERIEYTSLTDGILEMDVASGGGSEDSETLTRPRLKIFIFFIGLIIWFPNGRGSTLSALLLWATCCLSLLLFFGHL
jgi:hypothetical protein